mgnify:CR=1 FL=1
MLLSSSWPVRTTGLRYTALELDFSVNYRLVKQFGVVLGHLGIAVAQYLRYYFDG